MADANAPKQWTIPEMMQEAMRDVSALPPDQRRAAMGYFVRNFVYPHPGWAKADAEDKDILLRMMEGTITGTVPPGPPRQSRTREALMALSPSYTAQEHQSVMGNPQATLGDKAKSLAAYYPANAAEFLTKLKYPAAHQLGTGQPTTPFDFIPGAGGWRVMGGLAGDAATSVGLPEWAGDVALIGSPVAGGLLRKSIGAPKIGPWLTQWLQRRAAMEREALQRKLGQAVQPFSPLLQRLRGAQPQVYGPPPAARPPMYQGAESPGDVQPSIPRMYEGMR